MCLEQDHVAGIKSEEREEGRGKERRGKERRGKKEGEEKGEEWRGVERRGGKVSNSFSVLLLRVFVFILLQDVVLALQKDPAEERY